MYLAVLEVPAFLELLEGLAFLELLAVPEILAVPESLGQRSHYSTSYSLASYKNDNRTSDPF